MFFYLSKLFYQWATNPLLWVFVLWGIGWWKQAWRKHLFVAGVVVLFFFSNAFIVSKIAIAYQPKPVGFPQLGSYSCGLLLGGMTEGNHPDSGHLNVNADRLVQTVELYHRGHIKTILISGGTVAGNAVSRHNEARFVAERLMNAGVQPKDIIVETQARNTFENAVFSKKMLDSLRLKPPYLLITSAIHVPRSLKVYASAGFQQLKAYPANYLVLPRNYRLEDYVVPQIYALFVWQRLLKEWVGLAVYSITGKA